MKFLNERNLNKILAMIGLIADIITIIVFSNNFVGATELTEFNIWTITLFYFLLIYGWFSFAWYLSQQSYSKLEEKQQNQESQENQEEFKSPGVLRNTTIGIGSLLFPISLSLTILLKTGAYFFLHLLTGILVYIGLRLLIPVFYPDYKKYLHTEDLESSVDYYFGKWICVTPYNGFETEEEFKKDEFIVIYEGQGDIYYYKSSKGTGGKIHFSELDTYWEKQEDETDDDNTNTN